MNADIDLSKSALLIIDMQRDFLEEGGFASQLGNDVSKVQRAIRPCQTALHAARAFNTMNTHQDILILHTREGHRPDLADLHPHKHNRRGLVAPTIGQPGPYGRILVRGQAGHDIIPDVYPQEGEPIIDKPGKGSFYATDLEAILTANGIQTIFVCGVTSEVCVHTTIREGKSLYFILFYKH